MWGIIVQDPSVTGAGFPFACPFFIFWRKSWRKTVFFCFPTKDTKKGKRLKNQRFQPQQTISNDTHFALHNRFDPPMLHHKIVEISTFPESEKPFGVKLAKKSFRGQVNGLQVFSDFFICILKQMGIDVERGRQLRMAQSL